MAYLIGIDYGTDSARAVLSDESGRLLAASTKYYPRWMKGLYCDPSLAKFRHHPKDYLEVLEASLKEVIAQCPDPSQIKAIAMDSTSSTPCFVDEHLTPLALKPGYEDDPDAMFIVWKDHSTMKEGKEITALCEKQEINYSAHCGLNYSAECMWSKALGIVRRRSDIRRDGYVLLEACDFISATLTGCDNPAEMRYGHCSASAKHLWGEEWGGFPPDAFFDALDPALTKIRHRLGDVNNYSDEAAGTLSPQWAEKLGLSENVVIAVGNIDSYAGATAAGVRKGTLAMNIGTTGCFMTEIPGGTVMVPGVFGQVPGGIHRGTDLLEVGLAAFGDMFAWYRRLLGWMGADGGEIMSRLSSEAQALPLDPSIPVATDNFNGRRSPEPNDALPASICGLTINTTAPQIYRSLVEAASYATRTVIDHLASFGVVLDRLVAMGGVSQKSPFVMQTLADSLGREISVVDCKDTCALGDAMFAAVAGGIYPDLETAAEKMCPPIMKTYKPSEGVREYYDSRYEKYRRICDFSTIFIP